MEQVKHPRWKKELNKANRKANQEQLCDIKHIVSSELKDHKERDVVDTVSIVQEQIAISKKLTWKQKAVRLIQDYLYRTLIFATILFLASRDIITVDEQTLSFIEVILMMAV